MGNQLTEIAPNTPFLPNFQSLHVVVIGLDSAGKNLASLQTEAEGICWNYPNQGI